MTVNLTSPEADIRVRVVSSKLRDARDVIQVLSELHYSFHMGLGMRFRNNDWTATRNTEYWYLMKRTGGTVRGETEAEMSRPNPFRYPLARFALLDLRRGEKFLAIYARRAPRIGFLTDALGLLAPTKGEHTG